jgi:hypothetical protein
LTQGRLENIGFGGAQVSLEVTVPILTPIHLVLDPTIETPPLNCAGIVRSSVRDVKKRAFITGIQFEMGGESQLKTYLRAVKMKSGIR